MRIKGVILAVIISIFMNSSVDAYTFSEKKDIYYELAQKWAPIIYHDVSVSYGERGLEDIPLRLDFDGNWISNDNWENLKIDNIGKKNYDFNAYIYYSVVESKEDYYVYYWLFHPRDEAHHVGSIDKHENDIESIIMKIKKYGEDRGLDSMITQSHGWWNMYGNKEIKSKGNHPLIWVDSGGHALYAYDNESAGGWKRDGVIYSSGEKNGEFYLQLQNKNGDKKLGNFSKKFDYRLLAGDVLFKKNMKDELKESKVTFSKFGILSGDTHKKDKAAFLWSEKKIDKYYSVSGWADPALMFLAGDREKYKNINRDYSFNNNYTYRLSIKDIKKSGNPGDLIFEIYINEEKKCDSFIWKNSGKGGEKELFFSIPSSSVKRKNRVSMKIKESGFVTENLLDEITLTDIEDISKDFKELTSDNGMVNLKVRLEKGKGI